MAIVACGGGGAAFSHPDGAGGRDAGRETTAGRDAVADATAGRDFGTDAPAVTCEYQLQFYSGGTSFPSSDGCNTCTCDSRGFVGCSTKDCWTDGGQTPCTYGIDQSCNDDPLLETPIGTCNQNGTCDCGKNNLTSPFTGRCSAYGFPNECEYGGSQYQVGADFECPGSCDACHCDSPGRVSRQPVACDPTAGRFPCQLDSTYVYGTTGGSASTTEVTVLAGTGSYKHESTRLSDGVVNPCYPQGFPQCGDPKAVDMGDIMLDILDSAVAAALGARPAPVLFGIDTRAQGTPVTFVHRGDGGELLVGAACSGAAGCTDIPAGIAKLIADLQTLDRQELAQFGCSPWPTPGTFACYNQLCQSGAEYCATGQENGNDKFAMCRPYPGGCTTCACVTADAASVTQPNNQSFTCSASGYHCTDLNGPVTAISCDNA